ncbi:hypothetical protein Ddc_20287 [Ditylenchus destructor]|nr:hypothetical protein Ddc_20287 [Ditylenchus destructor]
MRNSEHNQIYKDKFVGLKKLYEILSTLAKRYGEGLQQKVQLVPLVLSRRIEASATEWTTYKLNVGVAVVAPEKDGYRALTALVLKLKSKRVWLAPDYNGEDYWNYDENVPNAVESAE